MEHSSCVQSCACGCCTQAEALSQAEPLQHVVLDVGGASHMDTTALEAIKEWQEGFEASGTNFCLVDPNPQVIEVVHKAWGREAGESSGTVIHSFIKRVLVRIRSQPRYSGTVLTLNYAACISEDAEVNAFMLCGECSLCLATRLLQGGCSLQTCARMQCTVIDNFCHQRWHPGARYSAYCGMSSMAGSMASPVNPGTQAK